MRDYDVYIFDLDGTLLDTLCDLAASCNHAMRAMGFPEHSIDDVRRFVGNGVRKLIERAVPDGERNPLFEQTLAIFRQHYMAHSLDTTRPYPGIIELLQELKSQGKAVAVVSNKFDAATMIEALRQLGAEKRGAVYVGDSDVDIATAANSGIPCISVLWGFRDRRFLIDHGATELVETPSGLCTKMKGC